MFQFGAGWSVAVVRISTSKAEAMVSWVWWTALSGLKENDGKAEQDIGDFFFAYIQLGGILLVKLTEEVKWKMLQGKMTNGKPLLACCHGNTG